MSFPCLFFNDTATTEIYTLSLHDALPISPGLLLREEGGGIEVIAACQAVVYSGLARDPALERGLRAHAERGDCPQPRHDDPADRKSTRLNSSHGYISYAVFCLKKKKKINV